MALWLAPLTSSVVYLHNTSSVNITNSVFENSCGNAIIALNSFGEVLLQNISIFHATNITAYCVKQLGGILWLNKKCLWS